MAVENLDDLNTTIADLIYTATGIREIIKADQDHSPPESTLYGTYNPIPVRAYGHAIKERESTPAVDPAPSFPWTDIAETTLTQLELMVSINFFNAGAKQAALMMQQSQFRQPVSQFCYNNGIAWRFTSESRKITGLEMATIQERYQLDLHLWVETSVTDIIMQAAGYSVEIYDEEDRLLTTIDGNVGA